MPRGRVDRFVETPTVRDSTTREFQRTVRSHTARVSQTDHPRRRRPSTRERNHGEGVIVFDANPINVAEELTGNPQLSPVAPRTNELTIASTRHQSAYNHQLFNLNTPRLYGDYLSGDTLSPIWHLTTYHKPYVPGLMNHYICNLTIPIPELDGNSAVPLFRAAWLPIVFHDPVVFQIVVLFAATHYSILADVSQFKHLYLDLLSLKQSALLALIQRVQNERTTPSSSVNQGRDSRDTLIAAATKMASYEAIFGTPEAFHLHMSTVTRLLRQQGGLAILGMNGFLARLLTFIETNSAFLLGRNLYLMEFGLLNRMPLHQPFPPGSSDESSPQVHQQMSNTNVASLERFIGLMNFGSERNEAA